MSLHEHGVLPMSIASHLFMRAAHKLLDWLEAAWHDAQAAAERKRT